MYNINEMKDFLSKIINMHTGDKLFSTEELNNFSSEEILKKFISFNNNLISSRWYGRRRRR